MENLDTGVLIVGAGPIGMILACALSFHGVPFRIIEQKSGPSTDSKAHNLIARSQELLESIGALGAIREQAYPSTEWEILVEKKSFARLSFKDSPTPYAPWLFSGQSVFEKCFNSYLQERGKKVERGVTFASLSEEKDFITAIVRRGEKGEVGVEEKIRCRYLVGADGVKGAVRKEVGLDFPFTEMKGKATRQIDARIRWHRPTDYKKVWFFLYKEGFAGILPVWKDHYRIFFLEDKEAMPARPPTLEEMQEQARKVTGDASLELSEPTWFSYGTFKCGVAPHYSKGRVFLAGDAGHDALPIGGQGMNTGVHDAIGLAWRLAMQRELGENPVLMESYGLERREAHADKHRQQVSGFNKLVYRNALSNLAVWLIGTFAPGLTPRIFGGADLQQLEVSYPKSSLSEEHLWGAKASRAGNRAPEAPLIAADGKVVSVHKLLQDRERYSWEWTLLLFNGGRDSCGISSEALACLRRFPWVKLAHVQASPGAEPLTAGAKVYYDLDSEAHRAFGLFGKPALVLVRPDAHVAFRASPKEAAKLEAYLSRVGGKEKAGALHEVAEGIAS